MKYERSYCVREGQICGFAYKKQRFYKGKKGNVGLGLSISQSCLQYLGGEITAYNTDCGACFDITLNTFN